jgi:hypothetical protein
MASTGRSGDSFDADAMYAQSFGNLPNKTVYSHAEQGFDTRNELNEIFQTGLKAHSTTTGGVGTAGYALIPVYVDPKIVDQSRKYTPLVEIFPRVTNRGMYADFNVITAKGGAFTRAEDAALTETTTDYQRDSTQIKFLYAVGRVTGPSRAAQPSYMLTGMQPGSGATGPFSDQGAPNAKQQEVLVKARELKELEENLIVNGNATTSAIAGNPNGTEFDGFVTIQGTVNKRDKNSSALTLADIDEAIKLAVDDSGRPNLAVCDTGSYTDLLGLLNQKIGYMQSKEQVYWGFSAITLNTMVGQVPVIFSQYLSNTSGSKSIYFLDLSVWEVRVLQDMTYEELAHVNDSDKFMMKIYETLICRATQFNAFIGEIA